MPQKETVFVVVKKTWFDAAMDPLVTGRPSKSQVDAHVMVATVDDASDHRGLWLRGIKSRYQRKDGSPVDMRLMIPWQFVLALGLVAESVKMPTGFVNTTVLTDDLDEDS
jgi:hypothetical protein